MKENVPAESPCIQNIAVYCSSHEGLSPAVEKAAHELGARIGYREKTLVYGGVSKGLMEIVAKAVKENGGNVVGVVPKYMECRGRCSEWLDKCIECEGLSERKEIMMREADIAVALPGGIGTLDEVVTLLATRQVGEHAVPVYLLDVEGCWQPFVSLLQDWQERGFVSETLVRGINVVDDISSIPF